MILSFFSVKIIPTAYAAHDCKLYISHLPISIWNEKRRKKAEQDLFSRSAIGVSFPYFTTFFNGIQRINAYTLPIREVTSCVTEKVVWNTAIFASIGAGSRFGIRISEITIPMNSAFMTDPAAMPAISPPFPLHFFVTSPTPRTRRALPAMIHGMIAGMAPMIGFLGTVVGMVQAFYDMAMAGNNINITLLSRGIYTAMITTVAGLIVGIIAYFAYNALTAKIDHIVTKMETASADFMEVIYEVKNEKENK